MAYVLKVGNFVDIPVKLAINDGPKTAEFKFSLTGKRISEKEWADHFSTDGAKSDQSVQDFLTEHITAWTGQTLVLDDATGQPAAFSKEAFEAMLSLKGVAKTVFDGYLVEVAKATTPEAKRKN